MLAPRRRRLALALYAFATLLSFPHEIPGLGALDLGLVFAWIGPAALVVGLDGLAPRAAARSAFWASFAGHLVLFHWFAVVTVVYGGMPVLLGVLAPIVPAYWVSQFSALFAALFARLAPGRFAVFFGACAWVAVDWLRGWFLGGFPWATLGYALHADLPLLGLTRVGGVYVLSFLAAAVGLALGRLALAGLAAPSARRVLAGIAVLLGVAHAVGLALPADPSASSVPIRIAAIQGNIDQGEKWDDARREAILETYLRLSREAVAKGARVVVWPETAIPGALEWDLGLSRRIAALARESGAVLVLGGTGIELDATGESARAYYDSAFIVDAEGRIRDRYDKTHLVPFGEFVPLRGLLGRFFESLASGLAPSDVTAGAAPRAVMLPGSGPTGASDAAGEAARRALPVGVPICYELIFPDLVRRFAADGAGLLLAVTNDAWYGRTGAPHQFLAMTRLRSAETGRFTLRAANTGISAVIDSRGRIVERTPLFEEAVLVADVPITTGRPTFYARFGDVFAFGCMLGALAGLAWPVFAGRSERNGKR